jgi:FkbM family methyltransferase
MVRIAMTPRDRWLETKLSNGAVVRGRNRPGHGGRGVYVYRDAIEPELEHLEALLDRTGVFIDIGANTGIYSLKAAKHFGGGGLVLALEPFPEVFTVLQNNIQRNRFSNVRAQLLCVAAETGERTLWLNRGRPSFFSLTRRVGAAPGMTVQTISLDRLVAQENLPGLDYLKIDAEGAEREIVVGGARSIASYRPIIQAEDGAGILTGELPEYVAFRAHRSQNVLYFPRGHERIAVPRRLGWRCLDDRVIDVDDGNAVVREARKARNTAALA